jgi:hypothetical protein
MWSTEANGEEGRKDSEGQVSELHGGSSLRSTSDSLVFTEAYPNNREVCHRLKECHLITSLYPLEFIISLR